MGEAKRRRDHCAYCGAPATSADHVPPKSLFAVDRTGLITVPSCDLHNGKRSELDERFREFVSLYVGDDTPATRALWETMARGIRRNKTRQDEIRRSSKFLPDLNMHSIPVDGTVFSPMVEQITRGLYWHCYKERMPLDVHVEARLMKMGDWLLSDTVRGMARAFVGGDQFFYAYQRMDQHPTISVWVYVFHRRVVAMALTDTALADRLVNESASSTGKRESVGLFPDQSQDLEPAKTRG